MERWRGKIAIVTGASAGIGAGIAERLVREGLLVVGLARRVDLMEEQARKLQDLPGKLHALKVDMSKEEEILQAFKWVEDNLGPVHILVNNAAIAKQDTLVDGTTATWKLTIDTNVLGYCIATREAIKTMRANNIDGHVVNMSGITAYKIPPLPNFNVVPGTKHAIKAITETLRQELNRIGSRIKVSSISPGAVKTEVLKDWVIEKEVLKMIKMQSALEVEDVVEAVIYMLSTPPHVQIHELIIKPIGEIF